MQKSNANAIEILSGIACVHAENDYRNWVKMHKPSLGPYTNDNPNVCCDCRKSLDGIPNDEPCTPQN